MLFKEDFLHFIWRFRLFNQQSLQLEPRGSLQIIQPGLFNTHAGPDFTTARVIIDGTEWAGQVEIHLRSSEWYQHRHQVDEAYANVILHVVYENDQPVLRKDGTAIPTLVLQGLFDVQLYHRYQSLLQSTHRFPCAMQMADVDATIIQTFLARLLVDRLEAKVAQVQELLAQYKGDWERTFYFFLARAFGFKVNAMPFEWLARITDLQLFRKYQDNPRQMEALLFGQAGFLEEAFSEAYPQLLQREYHFLQKKHGLQPMQRASWKFLRMRPDNFPTVRLAQFAALLSRNANLFSTMIALSTKAEYYILFNKLQIHPYWQTHYHFGKASTPRQVNLGKSSVENIIINTICLLRYVYGKNTGQEQYVDQAFDLLEALPAEKNSITDLYKQAGLKIANAYGSQAILQLNKNYCSQKKCLNCTIGIKILRK